MAKGKTKEPASDSGRPQLEPGIDPDRDDDPNRESEPRRVRLPIHIQRLIEAQEAAEAEPEALTEEEAARRADLRSAMAAPADMADAELGGDLELASAVTFKELEEKGYTKDNSRELRDEIAKYLAENKMTEYPIEEDRALWRDFKTNKIDANTFLRDCSYSLEFDTHYINLLRIMLQSKALHQDTEFKTRAELYAIREDILDKVSRIASEQNPDLGEQKAVVINIKELQNLVNLHGASVNTKEHKKMAMHNLEYLEAIEKSRQAVISSYEGLGSTEAQQVATLKRFRAATYKTGFFNGYKNNENGALENFKMLYGENCGQAIIEGYRGVISPNENPAERKIREEGAVLAWEIEKGIAARAFGLDEKEDLKDASMKKPQRKKDGTGNASMMRQQRKEEKAAIGEMEQEIFNGALVSTGMSLGLTLGVMALKYTPLAPFTPLLAGGLTTWNVITQIRGAYNAEKARTPEGQKVNLRNVDWKKVAINSLITSLPVMLASIPLLGEALAAAGIIPELTVTGITKVMPVMQVTLFIGLTAKGFLQTFFKARDKGIGAIKSAALGLFSATANLAGSLLGSGIGEGLAKGGKDAFDGGGFHPLNSIGTAIKEGPLGSMAAWITEKFGWQKTPEVGTPLVNAGTQSADGGAGGTQDKLDGPQGIATQSMRANEAKPDPNAGKNAPEKEDPGEFDGSPDAAAAKPKPATEWEQEQTSIQQIAILEGQETKIGVTNNPEQLQTAAEPVLQKIRAAGDLGVKLIHRYYRMTHGNYALPGPRQWLANILDIDPYSAEFCSFHKMFRKFDWDTIPTDIQQEALEQAYDKANEETEKNNSADDEEFGELEEIEEETSGSETGEPEKIKESNGGGETDGTEETAENQPDYMEDIDTIAPGIMLPPLPEPRGGWKKYSEILEEETDMGMVRRFLETIDKTVTEKQPVTGLEQVLDAKTAERVAIALDNSPKTKETSRYTLVGSERSV